MSISSSLNAGVMGLNVNSSKLATISDNISNSATKGYKRADVEFSSLVLSQSATSYDAGGVRANPMRHVDQRGAITSTRNVTDLAIAGKGFLPVIDESAVEDSGVPPVRLTTTGSFRADDNGYLKTTTGLVLMGWPAVDGEVTPPAREDFAGLTPVRLDALDIEAEPTEVMSVGVNLPYSDTQGLVETDYTLPLNYVNSLGGTDTLSLVFTYYPDNTAAPPNVANPNLWQLQVFDSASAGFNAPPNLIFDATVTFDSTPGNGGQLLSVDTAAVPGAPGLVGPFTPANVYDPVTGLLTLTVEQPNNTDPGRVLTLNIGKPNTKTNFQQLDADYEVTDISKDGSPAAVMTGIEVGNDGMVSAIFDTGLRRTLYQVPIGNVRNPNGLEALDRQTYRITYESGSAYFYDAGTGPIGTVISSALEESTTDIAEELTQMIKTQRAYSSNAKIIQTADEMLQETTNLKR